MSSFQKKRLAVFLDGTWNVIENNTNVWRAYSLCHDEDANGQRQLRYYSKGVGTSYGEKVRGGMLGLGLNQIIQEAYGWLVGHYNEGDDIFIFGFSRGAFAARSLAGLIAKYGVLMPGSPLGVGELYERYKKGGSPQTVYQLSGARAAPGISDVHTEDRWLLRYSIRANITMVGVWDTVGALVGDYKFLETGLRQSILNAFHALAIDEHRESFRPTLWTRNIHLDQPASAQSHHRDIEETEQRWFPGAHANVGGGYNADLLPQAPLHWLLEKAAGLGLAFRSGVDLDEHSYESPIRNSFMEFGYGSYFIIKGGLRYFRLIGELDKTSGALRTEVVNESVDVSAFERWRRDPGYRPKNLSVWADYHRTDPAKITTSVMAKDPSAPSPE